MISSPFLFNISGPYAVGKDTLLNVVLERFDERVHRVRTLTTRPSSPAADPSYTSVAADELTRLTATGRWIVNEQLGGSVRYATSLDEIEAQARAGKICIHSIFAGSQGAGELRRVFGPGLYSVGVLAAHGGRDQQLDVLRQRLVSRGRDSWEAVDERLRHQAAPIDYVLENPLVETGEGPMPAFDHVLVNDDLNKSIEGIDALFAEAFGLGATA